jgi:AMMECR1 domain-containing protein
MLQPDRSCRTIARSYRLSLIMREGENLPTSDHVTAIQALALLRLARKIILAMLGGPPNDNPAADPILMPSPGFELVNITITTKGRVRASMSGRGVTLEDAVVEAARRASKDPRFGRLLRLEEIPTSRLDLWIQYSNAPIDSPAELDLGVDGVELRQGEHFAYYKPSVPLTSRMGNPEKVLDRLAKKAKLPLGCWRAPDVEIRRTTWDHFTESKISDQPVQRLRRLRPVQSPPLTQKQLAISLRLAEDRLLTAQEESGLFLYRYHPFKSLAPPNRVQLVRQAGCAFALSRSAEAAIEPERARRLSLSVERAAAALLAYRAPFGEDALLIAETSRDEPQAGKLGTLALLLAALQHPDVRAHYPHEYQQMQTSILSMQRPDGSFVCRNNSVSLEDDGRAQDFYPGQALLALCLALPDMAEAVYPTISRAFVFYRRYFRRKPTTAFVLWQVDAWRRLAEWQLVTDWPNVPVIEPAAFVFEMVDWLLQFQLGADSAPDDDFIGGFVPHGNIPNFASAVYTEAAIRAYGLAARLGLPEKAARYGSAARLGLGFILRLQISPETAALFPEPRLTVGGTTHSLADLTIRCDYDQHTITALLAGLQNCSVLNAENRIT